MIKINMIKIIKLTVILISCILLANCSIFRQNRSDKAMVSFIHNSSSNSNSSSSSNSNNLKIKLPKPSELSMNISATQILNANYNSKSYATEIVVEASPKKITLVALSGMGTPLFTLVYDGLNIKTSYLPMPHINDGAKQALLNFILSYSPESVLQKMLEGSGIMLKSLSKQRLFTYDNKVIIKITYQNANPWKGHLLLENKQDHYYVNIDTISVSNNK